MITVPGQIPIAFVAKLKVYGFWRGEGLIAELLKILENQGATGLGGSAQAGILLGSDWRVGPCRVRHQAHTAEWDSSPSPRGVRAAKLIDVSSIELIDGKCAA
jgi:hypothetical protein